MKIPQWAAKRLHHWALRIMDSRDCDFAIGGNDNPVWRRWLVLPRNDYFNIYIHHWLRSDDDRALHNHPWASLAIHVAGRMIDVYAPDGTDPSDKSEHAAEEINIGCVTVRKPATAHRVMLFPGERAISIFCRGPDVQEWGFFCANGWKHWREYSTRVNGASIISEGCGE